MAIAASFLVSNTVGLSTTVAVFVHEIPHEIGDYAILVQSGFTKKKAMLIQVFTAFGALAGTFVGLFTGGTVKEINWILPFTAGGFIYIATVGVIPELFENSSFKQTIREVIAMIIGVYLMVVITWIE